MFQKQPQQYSQFCLHFQNLASSNKSWSPFPLPSKLSGSQWGRTGTTWQAPCLLSNIRINKYIHTTYPWTTWVLTAQVHLYVFFFFFFNKQCYCAIESAVGWILRFATSNTEGQLPSCIQIFDREKGCCPNCLLFKGQLCVSTHTHTHRNILHTCLPSTTLPPYCEEDQTTRRGPV